MGDGTNVERAMTDSRKADLVWLLDTATAAGDPGASNFRLDNATLSNVTNIYLDKAAENARLDEYIMQLEIGSFIWIQDVIDPAFNVLFATTALIVDSAAADGYFTIPVTYRRHVGTLTNTAARRFRFKFWETAVGSSPNPANDNPNFSDGLRDFNGHIAAQHITGTTWTNAPNPTPHRNSTISRVFAMGWNENQRTGVGSGNYFEDMPNPAITIPSQQNIHFFENPQDESNLFQGKQSWFDSTVRVNGLPLINDFRKIISFSAKIPNVPTGNASRTIDLLQVGPTTAQGLLRVSYENGVAHLQARRGNRDGELTNFSARRFLNLLNTDTNLAHWAGNAVNTTRVVLKDSDPIAQGFLVQIKRYSNGAFTGGESFVQNITSRDTDVASQVSTLFSSELQITHSYDSGFDNNGELINVIEMTTNNVGNATISYVVDVTYSVTESVQSSTTSSFQTINTVSPGSEIDLVFLFETQIATATGDNAPLQLKLNYNGVSDNDVILNLAANAFDFSDLTFGDTSNCFISQIQVYDYVAPQTF